MKSKKLIRNVPAILSVVMMTAVMVLSGCANASEGNGDHASVTIRLSGSGSGRAISDAEKSAATFNVYFNDRLVASNVSGTYTGMAEVGTRLKIRLDALVNGKRIARGEDTIMVGAGSNSVAIKVTENREEDSGGPSAPSNAELKSTPEIGSIIMKDGTLCNNTSVKGREADAIAVVYKVDTMFRKAWAIGKESTSGMAWATTSADGYSQNITALQEEQGYSDGSTGLAKLIAATSDAETELDSKYPAWDYACNYGKNQNLSSFQSGWYLPSKQELQEIRNQRYNVQTTALNYRFYEYYWSSSQNASNALGACNLYFDTDVWYNDHGKDDDTKFVCPVRVFTY